MPTSTTSEEVKQINETQAVILIVFGITLMSVMGSRLPLTNITILSLVRLVLQASSIVMLYTIYSKLLGTQQFLQAKQGRSITQPWGYGTVGAIVKFISLFVLLSRRSSVVEGVVTKGGVETVPSALMQHMLMVVGEIYVQFLLQVMELALMVKQTPQKLHIGFIKPFKSQQMMVCTGSKQTTQEAKAVRLMYCSTNYAVWLTATLNTFQQPSVNTLPYVRLTQTSTVQSISMLDTASTSIPGARPLMRVALELAEVIVYPDEILVKSVVEVQLQQFWGLTGALMLLKQLLEKEVRYFNKIFELCKMLRFDTLKTGISVMSSNSFYEGQCRRLILVGRQDVVLYIFSEFRTTRFSSQINKVQLCGVRFLINLNILRLSTLATVITEELNHKLVLVSVT